jgi:hypothetical protein
LGTRFYLCDEAFDPAEKVLSSLAGDGIGLKKATFLLSLNAQGDLERGQVHVSLANQPSDAMFIPIFE